MQVRVCDLYWTVPTVSPSTLLVLGTLLPHAQWKTGATSCGTQTGASSSVVVFLWTLFPDEITLATFLLRDICCFRDSSSRSQGMLWILPEGHCIAGGGPLVVVLHILSPFPPQSLLS